MAVVVGTTEVIGPPMPVPMVGVACFAAWSWAQPTPSSTRSMIWAARRDGLGKPIRWWPGSLRDDAEQSRGDRGYARAPIGGEHGLEVRSAAVLACHDA